MECTGWYFPKATLTFSSMEQAKRNGFLHHFNREEIFLDSYFYLLAENHLGGAQYGEMNSEHFSNSRKIPLESTWVIKSWKQRTRSPLVLIIPREKARATYALMFAKNVFEFKLFIAKKGSLSFAKPFLPFSIPTFPCNWLNTAICIIVIFFLLPKRSVKCKGELQSFDKVHIYVWCAILKSWKKLHRFPLSLSYTWKWSIQNSLPPEMSLACFSLTWPKCNFLSLGSSNNDVATGPWLYQWPKAEAFFFKLWNNNKLF